MTLAVWTLIGPLGAANVLRCAMHANRLPSIFMRRSVHAGRNFFGLFYWVLEQIGPGTLPRPVVSRA